MADLGQFHDTRTAEDYRNAAKDAREFYGGAPRAIVADCGAVAHLDMDGCGYRCGSCFAIVGSTGCPCT